jgi:recombination protein RecT
MTEQTAVAPPKGTQPLTTSAQVSKPLDAIRDGLEKMRPQLQMGLPAHITVDRFQRTVMTAINSNPDLVSADRRSLFNAAIKAAQDGLLPDGREGALVIFKDKTGRKLVQWMPMVYGLMKLIRQSGEIDGIGARIVFQRELDEQSPARPERKRFEYVIENGQETLFHDPILWGDRGAPVLVYAYAHFKDGGYVEFEVLHKLDVEKRRAVSKTADKSSSPWATWTDEMWKKTAIRALAKKLPLSADILSKVERDDEPTEFDKLRQQAMDQLSGPVGGVALIGSDSQDDLYDRAITGFANAADVAELDDFAAVIREELDGSEMHEKEKAALTNTVTIAYEARKSELANVR